MLTLALYNSYDPKKLHEAHLRAIARAAPICYAFDFHLALIGFPFEKKKPNEIAEEISQNTTIGEGGKYLIELARTNKFHLIEFPKGGFPSQFGHIVATTRKPNENKEISSHQLAERALKGESFMLVVGLGRHGLPKEIFKLANYHLDITDGKRISLETCTAIGSIPTKIRTIMEELKWRKSY
ncbi:Uncharacterized protein conserved in archaea (DUF531) [Thermococcus sp. 2319x1]|uniref:DUF531 domain-containing protein n=1 Tax=Thermococcus sp. 2319x1 TaxID=1674923 RepID=UPI00073A7812|nr:DUF531 domain-containing protein [Thermococcus sp. 2319x1]ALV62487.1 Uncharacterized protein conserved in archaea (DUF531) [Thermococcus sp. 2319x1]